MSFTLANVDPQLNPVVPEVRVLLEKVGADVIEKECVTENDQMENTKIVNPECNCHIEDYEDQLSMLLSLAKEIEVISKKVIPL